MLATELFTNQLLFQGVVRGLIYAMLALGIVLVYRSTRVINFAAGAMGVPTAALLAIMVNKRGWPYWPSLLATLVAGAVVGAVIELAVIRRLSRAPRVIVLVATLGIAELAQAVYGALPYNNAGEETLAFVAPWSHDPYRPGHGLIVSTAQILVLVTVPLVTLALWWLLGRTRFGEEVRATATNAELARMTGISPKIISSAIWAIAGALATLTAVLNFSDQPFTFNAQAATAIGPRLVLFGLTAALIGRMQSFPIAFVAAIGIGVAESLLNFHYLADSTVINLILFLAIVAVVAFWHTGEQGGGESFQFAPRVAQVPERFREVWWVRRMPAMLGAVLVAIAVVAPIISDVSSRHQQWARIVAYILCTASVVVLTGWAGQLSLGQMAFAGLGALTAAAAGNGITTSMGWRDTRIVEGALKPVDFPWTVIIGALAATLIATAIGFAALRVKGLLLAAVTLAFAIAANFYLYYRTFFTGGKTNVDVRRADLGPLDITNRNRAYYYFVLIVVVVVLLVLGRIRRSGIGRSIVGVRENEDTASAMSVSPMRTKLTAFALSGFLAGLGGALLAGVQLSFAPVSPDSPFLVGGSLAVVSAAVVGGLGSTSGAVAGAMFFMGLRAFFPGNDNVLLFSSSIGLLLVLLYFPGGITRVGYVARDKLLASLERRLGPVPAKTRHEPPTSLASMTRREPAATNADGSALATDQLTVRFGGLVAVDGVSMRASPGEVIGLIGTNGAGKSTFLNAIGGYVPSTGRVELLGRDIAALAAHRRARLGLGRTFQAATLYPELTVRETVQVALEARYRTSFWGTVLFLPGATRAERARRSEAAEIIDYLGLGRYADRYVAELSTGTRRIVELCCVLAVGPRVICLDEPTAGVAQREAEAFGPLIRRIQTELQATLLIVEHDMPLIMSISDRVYCLEAGRVIAEGDPATVRNDPLVVASYLGTDERAIARSNA